MLLVAMIESCFRRVPQKLAWLRHHRWFSHIKTTIKTTIKAPMILTIKKKWNNSKQFVSLVVDVNPRDSPSFSRLKPPGWVSHADECRWQGAWASDPLVSALIFFWVRRKMDPASYTPYTFEELFHFPRNSRLKSKGFGVFHMEPQKLGWHI